MAASLDSFFNTRSGKWPWLLLIWLIALSFALNSASLGGFWRWDDTVILNHVYEHDLAATFLHPEIYQLLSRTNLMPWLAASYQLDLSLFGLDPLLFYVHQLLVLALAAWSLYFLLQLYIQKSFAALGATLFLLGAPVLVVAQQLMTRHYIEGLVFSLWSLILFVQYLRNSNRILLAASALLFALSISAKEIYVPLVVLLPFLPESRFRIRLASAMPHVTLTLLYAAWRIHMLDGSVGGYAGVSQWMNPAFLPQILRSFAAIPAVLAGTWWIIAVIVWFILLGAALLTQRRIPAFSLLCLALILLPLVPLVQSPGISSPDRYLLVVWCAIVISTVWLASRIYETGSEQTPFWQPTGVLMLLLVFGAVSLNHAIEAAGATRNIARHYDVEGRFLWANQADAAFVPSQVLNGAFWYVTDLERLKLRAQPGQTFPRPIPDDFYLTGDEGRLLGFDPDCLCMINLTNSLAARRSDLLVSLRPEAPLSFYLLYQRGFIRWQAGPYTEGRFQVVSGDVGKLDIPPAGEAGVTISPGASLRLKYTAPEGWVTYSDNLVIEPDVAVEWSRP